LFTTEQGKRVFGFIAVGGSLGGILGPIITASLVHYVSTGILLLICAGMLEIAAQSVRFFPAEFRRDDARSGEEVASAEKPIGGKFWDGVTHICKSPYLFGLFLFIFLYTFTSMRPAREVLFTVLRREDKYKAKSFIDTFGYRCGDQFGVSYSGLKALGLSLSAISYIAVPVVAGWCVLGIWLGRKQRALAES